MYCAGGEKVKDVRRMAEHTPEPWHISCLSDCDWEKATFVEVQDATKEQLIAVVYIKRADGHCPSESEGRANAALIAAAPELYEMLKLAVGALELCSDRELKGMMVDPYGCIDDMKYAIAKAEGREADGAKS